LTDTDRGANSTRKNDLKGTSHMGTVVVLEGHPSHQFIRAIPVKPVDATAAGDAFCGALAAKLAEGMNMSEALLWANAAGALAVTHLGALPSLPGTQEVEALLQEAGNE